MAEYRLMTLEGYVQHIVPGEPVVTIPPAPGNADFERYQAWLADGGVPDPAPPPLPDSAAVIEQSYRAGLVRQADQLQAQGKNYEAVKLLFKANS